MKLTEHSPDKNAGEIKIVIYPVLGLVEGSSCLFRKSVYC